MKIKIYYVLFFFYFSYESEVIGQQIGFDFPDGVSKVRIPFERYNNLVVIPVTINHTLTLKFILDTGVQYPILTEKLLANYLGLKYSRKITIQGPGEADSIKASIVYHVRLALPGGIVSGVNQAMLVLDEDYLKLSNNMGIEIYGIIGYDIFSRFVVEMNFDENYLVLHEPRKFKPRKYYKKNPLRVVNTKPYVQVKVFKSAASYRQMRLMIDTGASHAILLDNTTDSTLLPQQKITSVIGRGIGGPINGYLGRMYSLHLGKFEFKQPIASFPLSEDYGRLLKRGSRSGTIGGEIMTRFNPIFDYSRGYLYLRRSTGFNRAFERDMSGMEIAVEGVLLDKMRVNSVRDGSPAFHAGIRSGDYIESINGLDLQTMEFADIPTLLRIRTGKKIIVRYQRNGTLYRVSFKLSRHI